MGTKSYHHHSGSSFCYFIDHNKIPKGIPNSFEDLLVPYIKGKIGQCYPNQCLHNLGFSRIKTQLPFLEKQTSIPKEPRHAQNIIPIILIAKHKEKVVIGQCNDVQASFNLPFKPYPLMHNINIRSHPLNLPNQTQMTPLCNLIYDSFWDMQLKFPICPHHSTQRWPCS